MHALILRLRNYHLAPKLPNVLPVLIFVAALLLFARSPAVSAQPLRIVALGDSLTAGYGLPAGASFADILQRELRSAGFEVDVINHGVSGDTTAGGVSRLGAVLAENPDGVILELGANDGLRGFEPAHVRANLERIMDELAERGVPVLLCGMDALANMGRDYGAEFRAVFDELAAKRGPTYHPFFLEGVFDVPELTLHDGLHPNKAGIEEIVRRILPTAEAFLKKCADVRAKKEASAS